MTEKKEVPYNKLVRDKIPEIIEKDGKIPKTDFAKEDSQFLTYLSRKLVEESQEFMENNEPEELADILEVLLAILHLKKISFSKLEKDRLAKREKRGGFDNRVILLSTSKDI